MKSESSTRDPMERMDSMLGKPYFTNKIHEDIGNEFDVEEQLWGHRSKKELTRKGKRHLFASFTKLE